MSDRMNDDDSDIKIILPSSSRVNEKRSVVIPLETTIENKLKLWRRKLSRRKSTTTTTTTNDDDYDDDIMPNGDSTGLANKYHIAFRNVTDIQYASSNINILILNNSNTLLVLELSRCGLINNDMINVIGNCIALRYLNLESNLLTSIPSCLSNLRQLQYLYLKRNQIGAMAGDHQGGYNNQPFISKEVKEVMSSLKLLSSNLIYLNTSLNPIATIQHHVYRAVILKSIPSLLALDSHIFSDDEHHIIKSYNIKLDDKHKAGAYSLLLPIKMTTITQQFYDSFATINTTLKKLIIPLTETSNDYDNLLTSTLDNRIKFMKNIKLFTSPISRNQRLVRRWLLHRRYHVFKKTIPILQAHIRNKLLMWRLHNEMLSILKEANLGHLLVSGNIGLTPEQIKLKVSLGTIKKFLRQSLETMRHYKCAIKIQRKFRTIINLKKSHMMWLQKNMAKGILVTADALQIVTLELDDLFRRRNTGHDINTYKFEDIAMKELIEAVKEHKEIETLSTYKSIDYDETFHQENVNSLKLHCSRSYHKLKRKNISKIVYQPFPKHQSESSNSLLNKRIGMMKMAGTYKILQHLKRFQDYSRSFFILKPRGNIMNDIEKQDVAYVLANKKYRYYETAKPLIRLVFNDIRVLCDIGLTLRSKNIQYNYDTIVYRNTAAIVIQRAYRGLTVRYAYSKKFIRNLISRRAIIAIQRWWRQMNTLIRRFKFHNHISQCCRSLSSNVVYLDAWTFFTALKTETLPSLCNEVKLFPEFRGVPSVNESGNCCFKYFHRDYMGFIESKLDREQTHGLTVSDSKLELSVSDSSKSLHLNDKDLGEHHSLFESSTIYFNPKDRARFGLPKWPFWSPTQEVPKGNELPNIVNSRNDEKYTLFDIITKRAAISAKIITPKYADDLRKHLHENVSTDVLGLHVIEIKFRSIQEARERCAMLMIASYDYRTRSSIVMCSADDMIKKVNNHATDIAKALLLTSKGLNFNNNNADYYDDVEFEIGGSYDPNKSRIGSHITPIEIKVQFNYCPKWVHEYEYTIRDLVRFRFLCESLRQHARNRQVIQKINNDDLNSYYYKNNMEIRDKNLPEVLGASIEHSIPQGSLEASQMSLDTNNQDSHLDKRYILDWDAEMPSIYANNRSMFSSIEPVNIDPGIPAPIIPTDSIGNIEPKEYQMLFDQSLEKPTRPKTSPKLSLHYKSVQNDDTIGRLLLWCSRDNEFDALKGGYDEKKLNLFSLTAPVILGSSDQSSTIRLENIILAEYYSYVRKCNSRRSEIQKPGSANAIVGKVNRSENVVDVIYKEYEADQEAAPQILYNVRRVFGCKEIDVNANQDIDWKEKLTHSKYEAAEKRRQEKEQMLKRMAVQNAFQDCIKQDIVRNVIKSRGESREKIAKKLSERDKNILIRESKSREGKNTEDGSSRESSREGNKDDKVTNDMNAFHDRHKQQLTDTVIAHKQQKQVKQSERLFCQNLQKSFNSLIKKTVTENKATHAKQQQIRRNEDTPQELKLGSGNSSVADNNNDTKGSMMNHASFSLASDKGSLRPDVLAASNIKHVRVSFSDLGNEEISFNFNGLDDKVAKMIAKSRRKEPKNGSRSSSFKVTLPSISTTTSAAAAAELNDIHESILSEKLPNIEYLI